VTVLIDLAVLILLLLSQIRRTPLSGFTLPLVLIVLGTAELGAFLLGGTSQLKQFVKGQAPFTTAVDLRTVTAALIGSLVLAAVFAAARVPTFRLWWQDGRYWRKGNVLTVVLWAASLGAHLLYDGIVAGGVDRSVTFGDFGTATGLLYFGVSLTIQRVFLAVRAARIPRGGA
jgi:hypothetical protein